MWDAFWDWFQVIFYVVVLSLCFMPACKNYNLGNECMSLGYSEGRWRMTGPSYCISRQNQSDIVVTVDYARQHPIVVK